MQQSIARFLSNWKIPLSCCILILFAAACGPGSKMAGRNSESRIPGVTDGPLTGRLQEAMARVSVPAVSVELIDGYKIEWAGAYGNAKAGTDSRISTETLFQASSITKAVSAATALKLVEKGSPGT